MPTVSVKSAFRRRKLDFKFIHCVGPDILACPQNNWETQRTDLRFSMKRGRDAKIDMRKADFALPPVGTYK